MREEARPILYERHEDHYIVSLIMVSSFNGYLQGSVRGLTRSHFIGDNFYTCKNRDRN